MALLNLPRELLIEILCFLDLSDLISCKLTNRFLHTIVETSVNIQYRMNLQIHGLTNNPACSMTIAERLMQLKAREEAWRKLKMNFRSTINVPHRTSGIYDLTVGVLVLGEAEDTQSFTTSLMHVVLPSIEDHETDKTSPEWSKTDPKTQVVDLAMGVEEHDLIAVVTRRLEVSTLGSEFVLEIRLTQFSTGKPHPSAQEPVIFLARSAFLNSSLSIEIVGDYLAIILKQHPHMCLPTFVLYDWRVGKVNMFSRLDWSYDNLMFLDHQTLLFANLNGSFDIFPIPNFKEFPSTDPLPLRVTQSLLLPPLDSDYHYYSISGRAEPNPKGIYSGLSHQIPPETTLPHHWKPFHSSSEDAIALFNVAFAETDRNYSIVVHRKALLAHRRPYHLDPSSPLPPMSSFYAPLHSIVTPHDIGTDLQPVPWTDWGPSVCRWINTTREPMSWITNSTGQRLVRRISSDLIVYDFNPYHVRLNRKGVFKETVFPSSSRSRGSPFAEQVRSQLPYVATPQILSHPVDSVMMDEERIIGLRLDDDNIAAVDVLHFG